MSYYYARTVDLPFDQAIDRVTEALKAEGFGVLSDIDVQATLKKKLDLDMPAYRILGACNPHFASQALEKEPYIGVMLPCNVVVREVNGQVEVVAVDPVASMVAVENPDLAAIAGEVKKRLQRVIDSL